MIGNDDCVQVIFSNEKVAGEGEHKLKKFVQKYGSNDESYMIFGMDADLFMLSLATHKENFHILRENPQGGEDEFFHINMHSIRQNIVDVLLMDYSSVSDRIHINDFILMIFLTGNDFLPKIQSVDISGTFGIEILFDLYKNIVKSYGPLTDSNDSLNIDSLQCFMGTLALDEKNIIMSKRPTFQDMLVEHHRIGQDDFDFVKYREEYYLTKMNCSNEVDIKQSCIKYIEGLQWV
jgi:5'-3' exonuclease